ncbi:MAG: glycosyltransferase family 2 protein [Sphingomonadaceae bacterium]|nr:glycosyltransferase family 2 protein [Sphingomonadaceae bacterium]
MKGGLQLAVIAPTLNERGNIEPLLAALERALDGIEHEVIFVDDGSTDGTAERVAEIGRTDRRVRIISRYGRRGLSTAVIEGMMATAAPIVAVIDADMQHDESILPALYRAVAEDGADLAVGTRYASGGSVGDWDEGRAKASALATRLAGLVLKTPLSDPMSGFFAIRRDLVRELQPRLSAIGFKILLDLAASSPRSLKVVEIPYRFRDRAAGTSKMGSAVAVEYLLLLVDKSVGRFLPTRLLLFFAVGGLGLGVHLVTLRFALAVGALFAEAQAVAVAVAILFNFALNNALTYRDRQLRGWAFVRGLLSFYLVCGIGAIANVGVGALAFSNHYRWWVAGVAGAVIGSVWNYAASSFVTWRRR